MSPFEGTTATQQPPHATGPTSVPPQPPLPRPPPPPQGQMGGHGMAPAPGHLPQHQQQQSMGAPWANRPQQQPMGMGGPPGGPSFQMPPQSPVPRGPGPPPPGVPPGNNHHPGQSQSPYHHPLHSQAPQQHHPQHQPPPYQQPHHHPQMQHHPQHHPHRPHPQQQHMPQSGMSQSAMSQSAMSQSGMSQSGMSQSGMSQPQQQVPPTTGAASAGSSSYAPPPGAGSASHHQQQFLPSGLNGDWQSDKDMQHRREMIQHIVKLLKQKDKNASPEWLNKLPQMVKQLEVSLYRSAPSFEAYADTSTLKHRLQMLAMEIARKTQQAKDRGDGRRASDRQQQQMYPNGMQQPQQHGMQRQGSRSGGPQFMGPPGSSAPMQSSSTGDRRQVVSMNEINPMMSGGGNAASSSTMNGSGNNAMNSSMSFMNSGPMGGSGTSGAGGRNMSSATSTNNASAGNSNDPEWKIRIRHKQQRLLLLHHSSKCPHEDGKCTVTQHCADMKRLWKHMARCTDNDCSVSHCFSSRSILSHYRKCKDPRCPACGPVRETVRKTQKQGSSSRAGHPEPSPRGSGGGSSMPPTMMGNMAYPNQKPSSSSQPQMNMMQSAQSGGMGPTPGSMPSAGSQAPFVQQQSSQPSVPPTISAPNSGSQMPFMNGRMPSGPSAPFRHGSSDGSMATPGQPSSSGMATPAVQPLYRQDQQNMPQSSSARPQVPPSSQGQSLPNGPSVQAPAGSRNDPESNKTRHKQQRLLLLRHASKCQYENGQCPVTPHCAEMKVLWKHIASCKDQHCNTKHCMSSRYVLSHYRRCKDAQCAACGPVRETIRKSQERSGIQGSQQSLLDPMMSALPGHPAPPMQQPSDEHRPPTSSSPGGQTAHQPPPKRSKTSENDPFSSTTPGPGSGVAATAFCQPAAVMPADGKKENGADAAATPSGAHEKPELHVSAPSSSAPTSKATPVTPKPAEENSLIYSFTVEQIETHIDSLNRTTQLPPQKLKSKCLEVLKILQTHQHGWVFATPVDPVELGLPDYFEIIKRPMDLGTIQKKLDGGSYRAIDDFKADVRLTFDNAMLYNEENSVVHDMAKELNQLFLKEHEKLLVQLKQDEDDRRKNERACTLCGVEKLLFEPPVFFCNGLNCPSKRIRRGTHFYVGGNKQFFWCNQCYNELDENLKIDLGTMTLMKGDLKRRKNDEVHEESWVQCDDCERWIHQICGLFNTRQNKEHKSEYCCPHCLLKKRKKKKNSSKAAVPIAPSATDLPRTKLSEWLEKHVREKMEEHQKTLAQEKAEAEKISLEEASKSLAIGGDITIRQVTSTDRKHEVKERMKQRYAHKNYPDEFPFRCKCIVVFQNLDGVDVVLFALYVYEHGEDTPPPNHRTVYISYLDSVHFMRPRRMRTFIYHEILISYLDYARQRGFAQACIWACPPLKGDDYIFYAKPEDQKTPKDARLRQWYIDMLKESQKRDIVGKVTNMYDLYGKNKQLDATAVPYLEGDYFPGEAENIIKDIEEGGGKKGGASGKKTKKKKAESKLKSGRGGTRSGSCDEDDISDKSYKEGGRDEVMVKFCEAIQGMKDSFIVAFLNWKGAKPEDMVVPQEIMDCREAARKKKDDSSNNAVVKSEELAHGPAPSSSRKRDADGNARIVSFDSTSGKDVAGKPTDRFGRPIKILDDDMEEMDCEFLNNRQAFLDLCRGNHYQFDQLRRAKHTSMMVLWHLQNREAPKFVQQCAACSREIVTGVRHHCSTCPDFDLCDDCFKNPNTNRGACTHKLDVIPVESDSNQDGQGGGGSGITEAQRKERQRNIQLHIKLIEHASHCNSSACRSSNCAKMKSYLKHGQTCKLKASGGCKICKRIWTLLRIHAQQCKNSKCPIPQCIAIRQRIRQLKMQQQAMDDRRRQEMNRHYRMAMAQNNQ